MCATYLRKMGLRSGNSIIRNSLWSGSYSEGRDGDHYFTISRWGFATHMGTVLAFRRSSECGVRTLPVGCSVLRYEGVGVQPVPRVALLGGGGRPPPHHHLLPRTVKVNIPTFITNSKSSKLTTFLLVAPLYSLFLLTFCKHSDWQSFSLWR